MNQNKKNNMPQQRNPFKKEKRYNDYKRLFMIGLGIVVVCALLLLLMEIF